MSSLWTLQRPAGGAPDDRVCAAALIGFAGSRPADALAFHLKRIRPRRRIVSVALTAVTGIDYDAGSTTRERSLRVGRSSAVRYTYQDLLSLPESASRHEILDGALHVTAAPRVNHQRVVDIEPRTVEVWRAGSEQPELAEDAVVWRVGDVMFRLGLERIFEGL
jgi:hypothetical protein